MDIFVSDCDECLHPFWEDELTDGMCERCQIGYAGNPNWAGDD